VEAEFTDKPRATVREAVDLLLGGDYMTPER